MRYFYAGADRQTVGPVSDSEVSRRVCRHCNARVGKSALWCPECERSTLDHLDAKLAAPAKRLAAQIIDSLTPSFGTLLIARLTSGLGTFNVVRTIAIIAWAVWSMMLFSNGMTPGKWLLGLYVVDEAGDSASFGRMLVREFIGKPLSTIVFGLGFAWILIDKNYQGWHDKLVDTYVVED
jgi:uncharacterized RDD family membrane protein YckC